MLVFLTIVGSFFGFMLLLALSSAGFGVYRSVRADGPRNLRDLPVAILDVLLMLVWGVVVIAAFMASALAMLAVVVALIAVSFASELTLPQIVRELLTIQVIYGIVIGASLVVGVGLLIPLFISELVSERRSSPIEDLHEEGDFRADEELAPIGAGDLSLVDEAQA